MAEANCFRMVGLIYTQTCIMDDFMEGAYNYTQEECLLGRTVGSEDGTHAGLSEVPLCTISPMHSDDIFHSQYYFQSPPPLVLISWAFNNLQCLPFFNDMHKLSRNW